MGMQSQRRQSSTIPWPHAAKPCAIDQKSTEQDFCLDEDTIAVVLLQSILKLPAETRRKLLMFVHQADEAESIAAEMRAEPDGSLELRLSCQDR